ncbi:MAG: hypothetical protein A3B38_00525 [Candidatus Levybacteria bacterium RIFCSPLOWO2_01_FULL_36_13]|nr:MAG: hypothetical protein A2684_01765 [Candidatus Levybacteria bacterium RIFCSPHIGHO2_01_FULL_36_15b]OGH35372.1 MAG: hypothetical protein A3B38_00525 [Candidatus Levybacteria bacterium RIFCSPLOWO2_01_FULL_36_13]
MNKIEHLRLNRKTNPRLYYRRLASIPARLQLQREKYNDAENQIMGHMMGEPSEAFYPEVPGNIVLFDRHKMKRSEARKRHEQLVDFARKELIRLARKQEMENVERIHVVAGSTSEEIFSSYIKTRAYQQTAREIKKSVATGKGRDEVSRRAIGKMFEDIVFGLLASASTQDSILLSPQKSYILAKSFYPNGEVVEGQLEQNYIKDNERAYVPDGYFVNTNTGLIEFGLEYTLDPFKDSMHSQVRRFNATKKRFSEIFSPNAVLILVTQKNAETDQFDDRHDVKVLKTPFSGRDLREASTNFLRLK